MPAGASPFSLFAAIFEPAANSALPVELFGWAACVYDGLFLRITEGKGASQRDALFEAMSNQPAEPGAGRDLHVVLVHPEIHGNTGSAGRSCLAAGAQLHVVEPCGFSLDDARVRRAGLDYWPRVRPRVWPSWGELEARLGELGEPWFFSSEAERDHWSVAFPRRTVLVFGCESVGLPEAVRERWSDRLLRLPMIDPELRSLNLANAVSVALYEVLRQRRAEGA